jgi:hypothetical protein
VKLAMYPQISKATKAFPGKRIIAREVLSDSAGLKVVRLKLSADGLASLNAHVPRMPATK